MDAGRVNKESVYEREMDNKTEGEMEGGKEVERSVRASRLEGREKKTETRYEVRPWTRDSRRFIGVGASGARSQGDKRGSTADANGEDSEGPECEGEKEAEFFRGRKMASRKANGFGRGKVGVFGWEEADRDEGSGR